MSSMISWLRALAASRRWLGEARYAGGHGKDLAHAPTSRTRLHRGRWIITALIDGELCIPTILSEGTHFSERDGRAPIRRSGYSSQPSRSCRGPASGTAGVAMYPARGAPGVQPPQLTRSDVGVETQVNLLQCVEFP